MLKKFRTSLKTIMEGRSPLFLQCFCTIDDQSQAPKFCKINYKVGLLGNMVIIITNKPSNVLSRRCATPKQHENRPISRENVRVWNLVACRHHTHSIPTLPLIFSQPHLFDIFHLSGLSALLLEYLQLSSSFHTVLIYLSPEFPMAQRFLWVLSCSLGRSGGI